MSKKNEVSIECPFCHVRGTYEYWTSVNADLNPELKLTLLAQQLNVELCRECHRELHFASEILYHDMSRRLMIELFPARDVADRVERFMLIQKNMNPAVLLRASSGYRFRYVWTYAQLAEKVRVFDAGLNDRFIEPFKNWLMVAQAAADVARGQASTRCETICFEGMDAQSGVMSFRFENAKQSRPVPVKYSAYQNFLKLVGPLPDEEKPEWAIVDMEYGKNIFLARAEKVTAGTRREPGGLSGELHDRRTTTCPACGKKVQPTFHGLCPECDEPIT